MQLAQQVLQRALRAAGRQPRMPRLLCGRRGALRGAPGLLRARLPRRHVWRGYLQGGRHQLHDGRRVLLVVLRQRVLHARLQHHVQRVGRGLFGGGRRGQLLLGRVQRHYEPMRSRAGSLPRARHPLCRRRRLLPRHVHRQRERPARLHRAMLERRCRLQLGRRLLQLRVLRRPVDVRWRVVSAVTPVRA